MSKPFVCLCAIVFFCTGSIGSQAQNATSTAPAVQPAGQATTATASSNAQPAAGTGSLSTDEKAQAAIAARDFATEKYAEALAMYKPLAAAHPGELVLAKLAAESAIDVGERDYALGLLAPIESNAPNDWQAAALLARLYAEKGDKPHRDAEMARMADLYKGGVVPSGLQQYPVEWVRLEDKTMRIWHSLKPWGPQKTYDYARVYDSSGQVLYRIVLASTDIDQIQFAKTNPDEAAKGVRVFSFDEWKQGTVSAGGTASETASTIDLFVGQPSYDAVREAFLEIAAGKYQPQKTSLIHPQTR